MGIPPYRVTQQLLISPAKKPRRVCCPQAAKTIQSCSPAAQGELAKGQEKVAWAMYVGEHTSQAASVGSVRQGRTDPARSGLLSPLVGKGFAFFDKLKRLHQRRCRRFPHFSREMGPRRRRPQRVRSAALPAPPARALTTFHACSGQRGASR